MAPGPGANTRTRSATRLVLGVALAVVLAALAPVGTAAAQPLSAAPEPSGGIDKFVSCLNTNRAGDMLLLFDESQSLRLTDPTDAAHPEPARVKAARYLLQRLARVSDTVKLDVALSGFAKTYSPHVDWTPLDGGSIERLKADVGTFASDDGVDTNYWAALDQSRDQLARKAAGQAGRCQALVWFSDGQLDFMVRDGPTERALHGREAVLDPPVEITTPEGVQTAVAQATDQICGTSAADQPPNGVADQLRAADVTTIGIGLAPGDPQGRDDAATFGLMQAITTGESAARTCGRNLTPTPGSFELASDIDQLLFAFDRIDPNGPPIVSEAGICQNQVCTEERHDFVLDSSVDEVHILGRADVPGIDAVLVAPGQAPVALDRAATGTDRTIGSVAVTHTWETDRTVSIDLTAPSTPGGSAWAGEWAVVFVDRSGGTPDDRSHTNIHIAGNLRPALHSGVDGLQSGTTSRLDIGLARTNGDRVEPADVPGDVRLSAAFVDSAGRETVLLKDAPKDAIGRPVDLDLEGAAPGDATLRMTLDVTTARPDGSPGTELARQPVELRLPVAPARGYPTVAGPVDFGPHENVTTVTAPLTVTGSTIGPGCVWVQEPAEFRAVPEGAGTVTVTAGDRNSAATCLEIPAGGTQTLTLTLTTETVGKGTAAGTVLVATAALDARDQVQKVPIEFTANLQKPLNVYRFVVALIVALLASLLPLLLLYFIKLWAARIPPGKGLHALAVPIQIVGGQVKRDGQPFALRTSELRNLVALTGRGARRCQVDGGVTLRARIGSSPFGAPFVTARGPDGTAAVSSVRSGPATHGRRPDARLPLGVHNHWVLVHAPAGPDDRATVLLLVGADNVAQADALVRDLTQRVPGKLADLRSRARTSRSSGSTPPTAPQPGPPGSTGPRPPGPPVAPGGPPPAPPGPTRPYAPGPPAPSQPALPPQSWPPATPPSGNPPTAPYPYPPTR